jgi:hypothetical protein
VTARKTAGEKRKQNVPSRPPGKQAIKFMAAAPRLEANSYGRQGIFADPHSKLAIRAA